MFIGSFVWTGGCRLYTPFFRTLKRLDQDPRRSTVSVDPLGNWGRSFSGPLRDLLESESISKKAVLLEMVSLSMDFLGKKMRI